MFRYELPLYVIRDPPNLIADDDDITEYIRLLQSQPDILMTFRLRFASGQADTTIGERKKLQFDN